MNLSPVFAVLLIAGAAHAGESLAAGCAPDAKERSLAEHAYVRIGGIEQWITLDGADCANPVILFVHGGPGNPLSPFMDQLYGKWKDSYTIATWDQRLSGRTYGRNEPVTEVTEERLAATSLTLDRLVADGIEVAEHLRRRLGKRKIILTGSSWGSVLGVHMAHERPDLFHAYVGVAQLVSSRENLAASHAATLAEARQRNDAASIATLEEIGPPPWTNPRSFGRMRRIIRKYEAEMTSPAPELKVATGYDTGAERAAYEAGEEISFIKYVGLKGDGMAAQVDLPALGTKFALPMFFVQGEQDLLTRSSVTSAYVASLQAPGKMLVIVPRAGHDPNFELIEAHLGLMNTAVLPLVK
jgi:pimeloyl-ACP methyl ester carboxylesterase